VTILSFKNWQYYRFAVIKPRIFDEKRGIAALLIKNPGFYFVRDL